MESRLKSEVRMFGGHGKATDIEINSGYNQGVQNSITEHTTPPTLKLCVATQVATLLGSWYPELDLIE